MEVIHFEVTAFRPEGVIADVEDLDRNENACDLLFRCAAAAKRKQRGRGEQ